MILRIWDNEKIEKIILEGYSLEISEEIGLFAIEEINSIDEAREIVQDNIPNETREIKEKAALEIWILSKTLKADNEDPLLTALDHLNDKTKLN